MNTDSEQLLSLISKVIDLDQQVKTLRCQVAIAGASASSKDNEIDGVIQDMKEIYQDIKEMQEAMEAINKLTIEYQALLALLDSSHFSHQNLFSGRVEDARPAVICSKTDGTVETEEDHDKESLVTEVFDSVSGVGDFCSGVGFVIPFWSEARHVRIFHKTPTFMNDLDNEAELADWGGVQYVTNQGADAPTSPKIWQIYGERLKLNDYEEGSSGGVTFGVERFTFKGTEYVWGARWSKSKVIVYLHPKGCDPIALVQERKPDASYLFQIGIVSNLDEDVMLDGPGMSLIEIDGYVSPATWEPRGAHMRSVGKVRFEKLIGYDDFVFSTPCTYTTQVQVSRGPGLPMFSIGEMPYIDGISEPDMESALIPFSGRTFAVAPIGIPYSASKYDIAMRYEFAKDAYDLNVERILKDVEGKMDNPITQTLNALSASVLALKQMAIPQVTNDFTLENQNFTLPLKLGGGKIIPTIYIGHSMNVIDIDSAWAPVTTNESESYLQLSMDDPQMAWAGNADSNGVFDFSNRYSDADYSTVKVINGTKDGNARLEMWAPLDMADANGIVWPARCQKFSRSTGVVTEPPPWEDVEITCPEARLIRKGAVWGTRMTEMSQEHYVQIRPILRFKMVVSGLAFPASTITDGGGGKARVGFIYPLYVGQPHPEPSYSYEDFFINWDNGVFDQEAATTTYYGQAELTNQWLGAWVDDGTITSPNYTDPSGDWVSGKDLGGTIVRGYYDNQTGGGVPGLKIQAGESHQNYFDVGPRLVTHPGFEIPPALGDRPTSGGVFNAGQGFRTYTGIEVSEWRSPTVVYRDANIVPQADVMSADMSALVAAVAGAMQDMMRMETVIDNLEDAVDKIVETLESNSMSAWIYSGIDIASMFGGLPAVFGMIALAGVSIVNAIETHEFTADSFSSTMMAAGMLMSRMKAPTHAAMKDGARKIVEYQDKLIKFRNRSEAAIKEYQMRLAFGIGRIVRRLRSRKTNIRKIEYTGGMGKIYVYAGANSKTGGVLNRPDDGMGNVISGSGWRGVINRFLMNRNLNPSGHMGVSISQTALVHEGDKTYEYMYDITLGMSDGPASVVSRPAIDAYGGDYGRNMQIGSVISFRRRMQDPQDPGRFITTRCSGFIKTGDPLLDDKYIKEFQHYLLYQAGIDQFHDRVIENTTAEQWVERMNGLDCGVMPGSRGRPFLEDHVMFDPSSFLDIVRASAPGGTLSSQQYHQYSLGGGMNCQGAASSIFNSLTGRTTSATNNVDGWMLDNMKVGGTPFDGSVSYWNEFVYESYKRWNDSAREWGIREGVSYNERPNEFTGEGVSPSYPGPADPDDPWPGFEDDANVYMPWSSLSGVIVRVPNGMSAKDIRNISFKGCGSMAELVRNKFNSQSREVVFEML